MDSIKPVTVRKKGIMSKLGGESGGHKNWKDRFFIFSDHLYYYADEETYEKDPKNALGRISLDNFYACMAPDNNNTIIVSSYPKSLTFRNSDPVVAAEWLKELQDYMNTVTIPAEGYISTKTVFISDVNVNNEKLERVQA